MKKEVIPKLPVVRAEVREYAQYRQSLIKAAIDRGENPHQLSLDLGDRFNEQISSWSESDIIAYSNMLAEELNAIAASNYEQVAAINQASADQAVKDALSFEWVVAIVLGIGFFVVFYLA